MAGELAAPLEVRVDGRTLTGPAMLYGERARDRAERFEPGALELLEPVTLNLQHDPERRIASTEDGSLRLDHDDKALTISTQLRVGSAELELVRRGALTGLSVEFHPIRERQENGLRVIERAALPAIGLVDRGSYRTTVELRRSLALVTEPRAWSGFALSSWVPSRRRLDCECSGDSDCHFAELDEDGLEAAFDDAFADDSTVIATFGDYKTPVASVPSGTLRRAGATQFAVDLPDDPVGRAVIAAHESAGVVVRPFLDAVESEAQQIGETMVYTKMKIRAFVISSTDRRNGWPTPEITGPERSARRFRRWL